MRVTLLCKEVWEATSDRLAGPHVAGEGRRYVVLERDDKTFSSADFP